jgi:two-component system LytT family response regulator
MLRAFLLDDEALALDRLARLLREDGRVEIVEQATDPVEAAGEIARLQPDLLFLDIQMPERDGFAVLRELPKQPLVIFATAFDRYALEAFETNSVAYLLKPVAPEKLQAALDKALRIAGGQESAPNLDGLLAQLTRKLKAAEETKYPQRVSSKVGDKVEFVDLSRVTHFYAEDKLTFAATLEKSYAVDWTITELEDKLDPSRFVRIHRATLVNVDYVAELYSLFAGRLLLRLRDPKKTELNVAKERAKTLRDRLGL